MSEETDRAIGRGSAASGALVAAELRRAFEGSGALLSGHFRLSSGRHSREYFQCALVLAEPASAGRLGESLAGLVREKSWAPEVVVSPALGGIVIGHEVARALAVRSFFAERQDAELVLRRGFTLKPSERVLVVEDVITTGKSTAEVVRLVRSLGGRPVGAASIVVRSAADPDVGVPVVSLARWPAQSYDEKDCPLCAQGLPAVKPGSRPEKTA